MNEYEKHVSAAGGISGASTDPDNRSAEEIERDIELTRQRMTQDIDELGARLSPRNLKNQAKSAVQGAVEGVNEHVRGVAQSVTDQTRRASTGAVDFVKEHPVPFALLGVGIAWMLMDRPGLPRPKRREEDWLGDTAAYEGTGAIGLDETRNPGGWRRRASDGLSAGVNRVSGAFDSVSEKAQGVAGRVRERAGTVRERTGEKVGSIMDENPLVLGAAALVIGAAVGLLLPETEPENRTFGPRRDQLMNQAREKARAAGEVAKETVAKATETAKAEIERQREELKDTTQDLASRARDAAHKVVEDARATATSESERRNLTT